MLARSSRVSGSAFVVALLCLAAPSRSEITPTDRLCNRCGEVLEHTFDLALSASGAATVTAAVAHNAFCAEGYIYGPCGIGDSYYTTFETLCRLTAQQCIQYAWTADSQSCTPGCATGVMRRDASYSGYLPPGTYRLKFDASLHNPAGSDCSTLCTWYEYATVPDCVTIDADADGYTACVDCDEQDPTQHPEAGEVCNGVDDNCDGNADEDHDGDGYGPCQGDCDDAVAGTHPGAAEVCDLLDNDCDGSLADFEIDHDGDGHVACQDDCDDTRKEVFAGAPELCDGLDNDCDGQVDEGITCLAESNLGAPVSCMISVGLPVNVATGNMYLRPKSDLRVAGVQLDFDFTRTYNSRSSYAGPLGHGWTHSFGLRLETAPTGEVVVYRADGKAMVYRPEAAGTYRGATGEHDVVRLNADGTYTLDEGERLVQFSAAGRLLAVRDPRGAAWECGYSPEGRLTSVTERLGSLAAPLRSVALEYDGSGRLWKLYPPGTTTPIVEYRYDAGANLRDALYADGTALHYYYEDPLDPHNLTRVTDGQGRLLEGHDYDAQDRAATSYAAGDAEKLWLEYEPAAARTTVRSTVGTKLIEYDHVNGVAVGKALSGAECGCSRSESWDKSLFVRTEAVDGRTTRTLWQDFDARGNAQRVVRGAGTPEEQTSSYRYAGVWLVSETDPAGKTRTYTRSYANVHQIDEQAPGHDPVTVEKRYYDEYGRLSRVNFVYYGYHPVVAGDLNSGLLSGRSGNQGSEYYGNYNAFGAPGYVVGLDGVRTEYTYDELGRETAALNTVTGGTRRTSYDGLGYPDVVTNEENEPTDYDYDARGRLVQVRDALGNRVVNGYDERGNLASEERFEATGTLRYRRSYRHDADDRLWKTIYADGSYEERGYDDAGDLAREWDTARVLTERTYDALGRLRTLTRGGVPVAQYAYNGNDQLTSVKDGDGRETTYEYDDYGFLWRVVSPDTGTTTYTGYQTAQPYYGLPQWRTDARGVQLKYTWGVFFTQPQPAWTYAYQNGQLVEQSSMVYGGPGGQVRQSSFQNLYVDYGYDAAARPAYRMVGSSAATKVQFGWDRAGRLASVTYPSGRVVSYERDAAGNIRRVTGTRDGQVTVYADQVSYHPFGAVASYVRGNGIGEQVVLDQDYRVESITSGAGVLARSYGYGADRSVSGINDLAHPGESQVFGYDDQGRLTGASGAYGALAWTYDAAGNRLTQVRDGQTTTYGYTPGTNRLASLTGAESASFGHDAAGNVTSDGATSYVYGGLGRLSAAGAVQYLYGVSGERIYRYDPATGQAVYYLHDLEGRLLEEYSAGSWVVDYIWLGERLLARVENAARQGRQEGFVLAKSAAYESDERVFTRAEQMHVKLWSTGVDPQGLAQPPAATLTSTSNSAYKLAITLVNRGDGAYEGVFDLALLNRRGGTTWRFDAEVRDTSCGYYQPTASVTVATATAGLPEQDTADDPEEASPWPEGPLYASLGLPDGWLLLAAKANPAPTVSSVTPVSGPATGGTRVVVNGTNFWFYPTASFGAVPAPEICQLNSTTSISCTTPPHACGKVDVTVTNTDGKSGTLARAYEYLGPPPPPVAPTDVVYYYHLDHLGTPQALTDAAGVAVWRARAEPFGQTREIDPDGNMIQPHESQRLPGQYLDPTTGLHQNHWRDYSPKLGRYLQPDPIGLQGGMNLYNYAESNPITEVDPFGLYVAGIGVGAGVNYWIAAGSGDCSFVWDDKGNKGIVCCYGSAAGIAKGPGAYAGLSTTHAWGADTVCDLKGQSSFGAGGKSGGGGAGPAINVSGNASGVNVNTGIGFGGFGGFGGWGRCELVKCWGDCCDDKCEN